MAYIDVATSFSGSVLTFSEGVGTLSGKTLTVAGVISPRTKVIARDEIELSTPASRADLVAYQTVTTNRFTEVDQRADGIEDTIGYTEERMTEYVDGRIEIERTEREKVIRRDIDGITIGEFVDGEEIPFSANLDADHLHFRHYDQAVAGIEVEDDGTGYFFGSDVRVTQSLRLGNFAFTIRPNGNMGLVYMGGE